VGNEELVDTAEIEAERLSLTTSALSSECTSEMDRAKPDQVEVMPRSNSLGKPK
jgi:hypothetical protein